MRLLAFCKRLSIGRKENSPLPSKEDNWIIREKVNIAILIPTLGGGGAERVASAIGNFLQVQGNNVYFFLSRETKNNKYNVMGEIVNIDIDLDTSFPNEIINIIFASHKVKKLKKKYNIDVSISFMEMFNYINIMSKCGDKVYVRVCTVLSKREDKKKEFICNKYLIKHMYSQANCIIVMTKYAKEDLINYYNLNPKSIRIIPNPVISDYQNEKEDQWEYGTNTIICVGRLEEVKQFNVAIRVFKYIHMQKADTKLIILGEGSLKNRMKNMIKKLCLQDCVFMLGFKRNVYHYFDNSRVCIVTSKVEGFHIASIEAMSRGTPVVSLNCPGGPCEIIGGNPNENNKVQRCKYGVLTPYIDNNSWDTEEKNWQEIIMAEEILNILKNGNLYDKYKENSLLRAQKFDFESIVKKWENIIKK